MGGPQFAREYRLDNFKVSAGTSSAWDHILRIEQCPTNLYLWGPCGVGKTHLAYAAARRGIERGVPTQITRTPQLSRSLRLRTPEEEQAILQRLIRAQMLVIDDLGMGPDTPYMKQVLQELLDGRAAAGRPGLIVTSKYSLGDLGRHLNDDTIPSRLAGLCEPISLTGRDMRLERGGPRPGQIGTFGSLTLALQ